MTENVCFPILPPVVGAELDDLLDMPLPMCGSGYKAMTLPTDSDERKRVPLQSGCYDYFPAALAGVARHSVRGNDKHNPGQPLHHARGKSMDHADTMARHMQDIRDLQQHARHGELDITSILQEADALAWRTLAFVQELYERYGGAPLAPAARLPGEKP